MNTNDNRKQQILRSSEAARHPVHKNGKGEKKRLLINSNKLLIQGEIFVHTMLKRINSVAIHNVRKHVNSHEAMNFFFNRVISKWNGLSPDIVNCDNVN